MPDYPAKAQKFAQEYGTQEKCDVFLYNGPILRGGDHAFIQTCRSRQRRPRVLLVLTTSGGDAHAGYRMARALQQLYQEVRILIPGWCKSAGTLIAIAANELIIGDLGELGPIDVQRLKPDDIWESSSGLTEDAAISTLETASWAIFERYVLEIKRLSEGQVTFKTAAEAAAPMVAGMLSPILAQIDPLKIGENSRAIKIASDYGHRLNVYSRNLRSSRSMDNLVSGYSSHGFVIDRAEAKELFRNVSEPSKDLELLCEALGRGAYVPLSEEEPYWSQFMNPEIVNRRPKSKRKGAANETGKTSSRGRSGGSQAQPTKNSQAAVGTTAVGANSNVRPLRRTDEQATGRTRRASGTNRRR